GLSVNVKNRAIVQAGHRELIHECLGIADEQERCRCWQLLILKWRERPQIFGGEDAGLSNILDTAIEHEDSGCGDNYARDADERRPPFEAHASDQQRGDGNREDEKSALQVREEEPENRIEN